MPTDKYPRTLQEAFGPHAQWHIDRRTRLAKAMPWLITVAASLALGALSWALQQ